MRPGKSRRAARHFNFDSARILRVVLVVVLLALGAEAHASHAETSHKREDDEDKDATSDEYARCVVVEKPGRR